ncbi:MAG: hypothetical protein Q8Q25_03220 [bacterium]|nr:hypothetical protein [bacterium]
MIKFILKTSKMALLAATLVITSQSCLANPALIDKTDIPVFIGSKITLIDQTVARVTDLFSKLFSTKIKFSEAVKLLNVLVTEAENKILVPMQEQQTRSSTKEFTQAFTLINDSYTILSDVESRMKRLVGCKNPLTFQTTLTAIQGSLSSQFSYLNTSLNTFYGEAKKNNAAYVPNIEKLLQTIKRAEKINVSKIVIFNRIYDFVKAG